MSVINLDVLSNDDLKRKLAALFDLDDWSDECGQCGRPSLLHKGGPCTRKEKEPPDVVNKIWTDFRIRTKPILTVLKSELKKETEDSQLLDGLKKVLVTISGQNAENMNALVCSLKDSFKKEESDVAPVATDAGRITKLTKPAKVPSWSKNMSMETFVKQIETWTEINEDVPEFVKYHDFIESLKVNKDVKDLP